MVDRPITFVLICLAGACMLRFPKRGAQFRRLPRIASHQNHEFDDLVFFFSSPSSSSPSPFLNAQADVTSVRVKLVSLVILCLFSMTPPPSPGKCRPRQGYPSHSPPSVRHFRSWDVHFAAY